MGQEGVAFKRGFGTYSKPVLVSARFGGAICFDACVLGEVVGCAMLV